MTSDEASPTKLQALVDRYRRGDLTRDDYLEHLRRDYHSVHARVRSEALTLLDALPEPERTRELIWFATECQWRETRVDIVRALGTAPQQRGLEFLIHLAADDTDLGMCREAIAALGRSKDPLAARYLATRYRTGPATLKPYVAYALGELLDVTLSETFIADLEEARRNDQVLWAQSLALALAELHVSDCVATLADMLHTQPRSVAISALLALGKLADQPIMLEAHAGAFTEDFVEWQIFTNARQHIELRARWSIEDYLDKLFDLNTPFHPGLALTLNRFSTREVREGLEFFRETPYRLRLAEVLMRLRHPQAMAWFEELVMSTAMTEPELTAIFSAMQSRSDQNFESLLYHWREYCLDSRDDGLYEAWLRACALTLPHGGHVLAAIIPSQGAVELSQGRKVILINQLTDYALSVMGDTDRLSVVADGLETWLQAESDHHVVGRLLRALGQTRSSSTKSAWLAKKYLREPAVRPSALQFFQSCPQELAFDWLLSILPRTRDHRTTLAALLRAMAAQEDDVTTERLELDAFLEPALLGTHGKDVRLAALTFLTRHPRVALFQPLLNLTNTCERVRIATVVALKSFCNPKATSTLITFLDDPAESIAGRALDSLTAQPDDNARWAILDFLDRRLDDLEVVDKVARCLTPPVRNAERFVDRLNKLIAAHPQHPFIDGLIQLRDRFTPSSRNGHAQPTLSEGAAHELDRELTARLNGFSRLDEQVKSALRSAELPYLYPDVFHGDVDKSTSILEYCKAVDLFLERYIGGKLLFPKLRDDLTAFQNTVYRASLNEQYPNPSLVIEGLGLQGLVTPEALPIAKMVRLSHQVLNGRLQQTPWRFLDGLRAWSAVLLLFVRAKDQDASSQVLMPIRLPGTTDQAIVELALHLDHLQGLRNPVAHRRTLVAFADIETIRNDISELFTVLDQLFP